jgi:ABC-type nitrate/sulfonate/bicarbonate transport system ATPase subunit
MITHDVDEAVLLSDRIVMLTNGPAATIGDICEVGLDRPRRTCSGNMVSQSPRAMPSIPDTPGY